VDNPGTDLPDRVPVESHSAGCVRANRSSAERHYTGRLRIRTEEGADNGLARAAIEDKLRREWKLVGAIPGPDSGGVEPTWSTTEG
jgi:hypothetical protein